VGVWTKSIWLRIGTSGGSSWIRDEPAGSIKCGNFLISWGPVSFSGRTAVWSELVSVWYKITSCWCSKRVFWGEYWDLRKEKGQEDGGSCTVNIACCSYSLCGSSACFLAVISPFAAGSAKQPVFYGVRVFNPTPIPYLEDCDFISVFISLATPFVWLLRWGLSGSVDPAGSYITAGTDPSVPYY
jgi:hypothetical protein